MQYVQPWVSEMSFWFGDMWKVYESVYYLPVVSLRPGNAHVLALFLRFLSLSVYRSHKPDLAASQRTPKKQHKHDKLKNCFPKECGALLCNVVRYLFQVQCGLVHSQNCVLCETAPAGNGRDTDKIRHAR